MPDYGADAHFTQGSAHEAEGTPCQDWALAGGRGGLPFALVADGCSTSGMTDVGARLLVLGAARALSLGGSDTHPKGLRDLALAMARGAADLLALSPPDLDATLGLVAADGVGGAVAMLFGDGAVAWRPASGGLEATIVDWAGSMPGYPAYLSGPESRLMAFLVESERLARDLGRPPCVIERVSLLPDGGFASVSVEGRSARDGLDGLILRWNADEAPDVVAVTTDGVQQVGGVCPEDALLQLTAIKSARAGAFARRRMSRALADWSRLGFRPTDDLAVAALAAGGASGT